MKIPKVFISYSHDSLEHKKWVLELATRLRTNGIDAIIDQWELSAGSDIPTFMEQNLSSADYIIMICTENYVQKANKGTGGVGYEKMIVTSTLMSQIDDAKVIPIVRQAGTREVPTFLKSKLYIDFSKPDEFEIAYDNLVRTIHKSPIFSKPSIGDNPFERIDATALEPQKDPIKNIMQFFVDQFEEQNEELSFDEIVNGLMISRIMLKYLLSKMMEQGLIGIADPLSGLNYYSLTSKGINYSVSKGLINK